MTIFLVCFLSVFLSFFLLVSWLTLAFILAFSLLNYLVKEREKDSTRFYFLFCLEAANYSAVGSFFLGNCGNIFANLFSVSFSLKISSSRIIPLPDVWFRIQLEFVVCVSVSVLQELSSFASFADCLIYC